MPREFLPVPQVMVFHSTGSSDRQELVIGGRSGVLRLFSSYAFFTRTYTHVKV